MTFTMPPLRPEVRWSIRIVELDSAEVLLEHEPDAQLKTASVGKIFLLVEVARRLFNGTLRSDARIEIPEAHRVADSGILYRFVDQRVTVADAALLVAAFSDNLATNALIHLCGLERVRAVAGELGLRDTGLLDYIRDERGPEHPWTPSFGTARELADVMRRLDRGEIVSREVSRQVLDWLGSDADTSMLADALLLDSLAHVGPEYQGMVLRHKTGSIETARIDVGVLRGPRAGVAYAVGANWAVGDKRASTIDTMRELGEQIRRHVTGLARDEEGDA